MLERSEFIIDHYTDTEVEIMNRYKRIFDENEWEYKKTFHQEMDEETGRFYKIDKIHSLRLPYVTDFYDDSLYLEISALEYYDGLIEIQHVFEFGNYVCSERKQNLINEYMVRFQWELYNGSRLEYCYDTGTLSLCEKLKWEDEVTDEQLVNYMNYVANKGSWLFYWFREVFTERKTPKEALNGYKKEYYEEMGIDTENDKFGVQYDYKDDFSEIELEIEDAKNHAKLNNQKIFTLKYNAQTGEIDEK